MSFPVLVRPLHLPSTAVVTLSALSRLHPNIHPFKPLTRNAKCHLTIVFVQLFQPFSVIEFDRKSWNSIASGDQIFFATDTFRWSRSRGEKKHFGSLLTLGV